MTPGPSWEFAGSNRFTVGAVGEPGARVFYFQVFADGMEVNVKCEKQQAIALAAHLVDLLDDLPEAPGEPPTEATESLPPTNLEWTVGSISIGVDRSEERIVVLFEEADLEEDEDDGAGIGAPGRLRVSLTREQVMGFAGQVEVLASASRPICRLCDRPIDRSGHACPRLN